MSDLDIIIFAIAGVVIILINLYVVISMTRDINKTIHKCKEIEEWAKTNWKGEPMIENCPMRHENGNCIPAGGFCTANKNICEALLNAYRMGKAQLSSEGTTFDMVSRQAAIDAIANCTNCGDEDTLREYVLKHSLDNGWTGGILEALDAVKDLPTVQPEPPWILCSEKMPEEYGNYLISIHGEDEPDIGTINPNDKRGWSLCDANGFHWASDKKLIVTAWMPLPEPYRKGAIK